jgi:hypothetical protein
MSMPNPNDQPSVQSGVADTSAPAPKRFLSSLTTTTLWTALAAVLLGVGVVPWLLSDPARISGFIAKAVPGLQADVSIGRASIGWIGPILLEDVKLVPHNGSRSPLSIARIEGSHGLAGMLLSLGDLGRFRVEGMRSDVVFDADRNSNLSDLFMPTGSTGQTAGPRPPRRSPVRVRFEIEDAVARIEGPWSPDPWESEPTDIRVALGPSADGDFSEWRIDGVKLLDNAKLEANVAQGVLAYIAPVLADATRTSGRFSLKIDGGTFPIGAPEAARLSGSLAMHEVDLGPGPLVANMMNALPGRLQLPSSIRVADDSNVEFHLAERRVWHKGLEFGVPLTKPGQRLDIESSGSVGLDDKVLDLKFALPIPSDLPGDRPMLAALAGKSISIGIGGVLGQPKVNFDGSIRATAGDVIADLIDRLRSRGEPQPAQPSQPPAPNWIPPQPAGRTDAAAARDGKDAAGTKQGPPAPGETRTAGTKEPIAKQETAPNAKEGTSEKLERIKSALPADVARDPSTDAVIDLVGGVLDEVAKRRAERAAAAGETPDTAPPPRRGRVLRRLTRPPVGDPAAPTPQP